MNSQSISKRFADFISFLTHPVWVPFWVFWCYSALGTHPVSGKVLGLGFMVVAVGTFILPFALVLFFMRMGAIKNVFMKEASERRIPFTMAAFSYYFTAKALGKLPLPYEIYLFFLASSLLIFLLMLGLRWMKISAHMAAMGGFLAAMAYLAHQGLLHPYFIILLSMVIFLAAWARLKLKAHTPAEVIAGFILGFGVVFYFLLLG